MGLLAKLFSAIASKPSDLAEPNKKIQPNRGQEKTANLEVLGGFISVESADFYGKAYVSPNNQWILGCRDSNGDGSGGFRETGNGRVLLIDTLENRIAYDLTEVARPVEAAVANSGIFVINDCGFKVSLSGTVQAFNSCGEKLYSRQYSANVYSVGISKCGRYIAVQTANAPKSTDGHLLEVHDVITRKCLFSISPATPWSTEYHFDITDDGNLERLWVNDEKLGRFAYSAAGRFLDAKKLQQAILLKGETYSRLLAIEGLLKNSECKAELETALKLVDEVAINAEKAAEHDQVARAWRLRGEVLEALDRALEAAEAYENALAWNPKIGVKKRLERLKRIIRK